MTWRRPPAVIATMLLLAGCGGTKPQEASPDRILQRETHAARTAFEQERLAEAITQYRAALQRAAARDDLTAIGDLTFNLAVAELAANRPRDALATARGLREELRRRGAPVPADLDLVEATALFRAGGETEADVLAARAQAAGGATGARASLLRGLIADRRSDVAGLRAALRALDTASGDAARADRAELTARLALREGDPARAGAEAAQAAALRRDSLDLRGVARALGVAAEAARLAGDPAAAADLYLRAGRSAAAQGDAALARPWLRQAMALTHDASVRAAADASLKGLDPAR